MDNYIRPNKNEIKILYPPSGTPEACQMAYRMLIGQAVLDNRFLYAYTREEIGGRGDDTN